MSAINGMNYFPKGNECHVVKPGEFIFSAARLDHGHIYGMCNALVDAGGTLKLVYDPDPEKAAAFKNAFPQVTVAESEEEVLGDKDSVLIAGAAVPSERCALGLRVMDAGKDYFTDKTPFTTLGQLESARKKVKETGRKYMVYYSERLHSEGSVLAGYMIADGAIGKVYSITGFGPHRLTAKSRPAWFFEKEKYGGILCDIGSHQIEQFLTFAGEEDACVSASHVANYGHPEYPELEDYGDCSLIGKKGTACYFRTDWFTPDGLSVWGDGRVFVLGTKGYIEIRKYSELTSGGKGGNHIYLVDDKEEKLIDATGTGYPFFGELILDCLNRTEKAMTQEHAFKAAELCLKAQALADVIKP